MSISAYYKQLRERFFDLLRFTEKYTKVDMVYLFSGLSWSTAGQFVSSGTAFLGALAFAHFLSQDTYGTYKFVQAIGGLLSIAILPGVTTGLTRAVARGFPSTFYKATYERIRFALVGVVVGLMVAAYYFIQGNHVLCYAIAIAAITLPFFETFLTYDSYLQGKKEFGRDARVFACIQITSYALLIAAIFFTHNLYAIIIAYYGSYSLLRYLAYRYVKKEIPKDGPIDHEAIPYGKHLSLMNILGVIANNIDSLLLFHYVGPAELAIYNFATAIPDQVKGPLNNIGNMLTIKFSSQSPKSLRARMYHKIYWLLGVNVVLLAAYWIAAPYIYEIFFPRYLSSVFYSQLFATTLLTGAVSPIASYFTATKLIKEQYITNVLVSLFQIGTIVCGALFGGLFGIILARIATRFFSAVLSYGLYLIERPTT